MDFLYILTLETREGGRATCTGVIAPREGATRQSVLMDLKAEIERARPALHGSIILYFSLERDALYTA